MRDAASGFRQKNERSARDQSILFANRGMTSGRMNCL